MNPRRLLPGALLFVPALAFSHHFMDNALPRTFSEGLLSGLGHPIIGLDHALFIIATGFFLGFVPRGLWGVLALVLGSLAGAALHLAGIDIPGGEIAVAVSVVLIGVLLIVRRQIPLGVLCAGIALAGVLHGHAYAESIFGAETAPLVAYLAGFCIIQFLLASAAFFFHRWNRNSPALAPVLGGVVGAIGAIGLVFLVV